MPPLAHSPGRNRCAPKSDQTYLRPLPTAGQGRLTGKNRVRSSQPEMKTVTVSTLGEAQQILLLHTHPVETGIARKNDRVGQDIGGRGGGDVRANNGIEAGR